MTHRLVLTALLFVALIGPRAQAQTGAASGALWQRSDSTAARRAAEEVLRKHPKDVEANFVAMEAAALQDDSAAVLDAAMALVKNTAQEDPRREIAIARIRALASNSDSFRARAARVRLLAKEEPLLRAALVNAAADGIDQYELLAESREAGLITDWRIAGPFGEHSQLDFQKRWAPESDGLRKSTSGRKRVESLQFPTGLFALPSYLPRHGVYYAAGMMYVDSTGDWNVFFETPGAAALTLDGQQIIAATGNGAPRTERITLHLKQGDHQLLVKFTAASAPFRVALLPVSGGQRRKRKFPIANSTESDYVQASLHYWRGDLVSAIRDTQALLKRQPSAISQHLAAEIWRASSEDAPEALAAERNAIERDPAAAASLLAVAREEFEAENLEPALRLLRRALRVEPRSERATELQASIMSRLRWESEATAAYERWIEIHPSCRALEKTSSYFGSTYDFGRARAAEARLEGCSPDSLALAEALARRGEHAAAADAARKIADRFPMSRSARELEIRESLLARDFDRAQRCATELISITPAMPAARQLLAQSRARTEFASNAASREWLDEHAAMLHRDALQIIRQASKSTLSGSAILLLNDEAVLDHGGERWHYRHRITRLNSRDAIVRRSEVTVPSGATVMALRSISGDGEFAEPELTPHKAAISMPALAPGSAIEEEYLWRGVPGAEYRFALGSFDLPIALSRFSFISDAGSSAIAERNAPEPKIEGLADGTGVRRWESNEIAQTIREDAMPSAPVLPAVLVTSGDKSLTAQRLDITEAMLAASSPGPRTALLADTLRSGDEFETAQRVYRATVERVRTDGESAADATSAEDSIGDGEGSRAAVLLALAQEAKVHVELFVLRRQSDADVPSAYEHLVAVFFLQDGRRLLADLENNGLPLGVISPELARQFALPIVSADSRGVRASGGPLLGLPQPTLGEESAATGDLTIDESGTLRAAVDITMGPWRGSQLRESLRGMSATSRQQYFEQLAGRLFPRCGDVDGNAANEDSPDRLLRLHVECTAEEFVEVRRGVVELSPLMPPLSLRNLYGSSSSRKYPLYVGAVLDESTEFTLHLPEGMELVTNFANKLKSPFGQYSYSVTRGGEHTWKLSRAFRVPIQRVAPDRYSEFAGFAAQSERFEQTTLEISAQ